MQHDPTCTALRVENKDCDCSETTEMYYVMDARQIVGNCIMWWREGGKGYTCNLKEAWKVTKRTARQMHRSRNSDMPYKVIEIDKVAQLHVDFQILSPEFEVR